MQVLPSLVELNEQHTAVEYRVVDDHDGDLETMLNDLGAGGYVVVGVLMNGKVILSRKKLFGS